jgi:hypothetical protein
MGARVGLKKPVHHSDPDVNDFMESAETFADAMEGDLVIFDHPSNVPAGGAIQVRHDLGEVPGSMVVEDPGYTGGRVYATMLDREKWTKTTITVRSDDAANRQIAIRVRKRITEG